MITISTLNNTIINTKTVSLILTTYNCKDNLIKTFKSIEEQDYPNIEVCISDSCSTDGTLDVIEEYAKTSHHSVVYKSEKDSGIYDGINRAIAMSTGDYLEIMNDEYTCSDAVSRLVNAIEIGGGDYVGAHADLVYQEDGKVRRYWKMGNGSIYSGWMPAHPTLLLKREIYDKYGEYDTSYVCSADYEFMIRFLKDKNKVAYVPETLVSMFYGGTSTGSASGYTTSVKEALHALKKNRVHFGLFITGLRTLRVMKQFRVREKKVIFDKRI